MLKKINKFLLAVLLTLGFALFLMCAWWYAPVVVHADSIEKVVNSDISENRLADCSAFKMDDVDFRNYWRSAKPIFEFELHDYSFGSCYYKSDEGGATYVVGIGGVGMVWRGQTTFYYAKEGVAPDANEGP